MKKIIFTILILFIPLGVNALDIKSTNYLLYNETDGTVLLEQNSEEKDYVASLTKIATAIVAIENIDNIHETVVIPQEGLAGLSEANASVAGFRLGQVVTYEDLLYGLMLPSGGDAAQTLAFLLVGSNEEFVNLMNKFVLSLGLENTNFENTTGLYDENHYSTVSDMLEILKYALNNDTFKEIFTSEKYLTSDTSITFKNSFVTINEIQNLTNEHILGGKTGYINQAGFCFASIATINDIDYILITTGADATTGDALHIMDAHNIYSYVEETFKYIYPYKEDDILGYIDVKYSDIYQYTIKATDTFQFLTDTSLEKEDFTFNYIGDDFITPETKSGKVGIIEVVYNNKVIHTTDVIYDGSVNYSFEGLVEVYWQNILVSVVFIIIILITLFKVKNEKRKN